MKFTKKQAEKIGNELNLNFKVVNLDEWLFGLNVELEHGKLLGKKTNITDNNLKKTAQIALAHLIEDPKYYKFLKQMEEKREKYWKTHTKPNIFN